MLHILDMKPVIVAIGLKGSARLPILKDELEKHQLYDDVHMYLSERDCTDGVRGCFLAHQSALKMALTHCNEKQTILVLEDDFIVDSTEQFLLAMSNASKALNQEVADIVALGAVPISPLRSVVGHPAVRLAKWQMTHAYMVSQKTASQIAQWEFVYHQRCMRFKDHYDQQLSIRLKQAIVIPTVAFQRSSSDLTTTNVQFFYLVLTHMRNLVQVRTMQRVAEWFFGFLGRMCECAAC